MAAARPWGVIATVAAVAVLAVTIIGYAAFASWRGTRPWGDRLAEISGLTDYKAQKPAWLTQDHKEGPLDYAVKPSVGGDHNGAWQNCTGDVYPAPIAAENATHSLEHGAVWVTYRPGLPAEQVRQLEERVRGKDYTLMSPQENTPGPISLQAWGYQLVVDSASDERIDTFLSAARINAGPEVGAPCSRGITDTGTAPPPSAGG
ncbi:DUF3105 domain-containing protein [Spirilliplanes yamanashiensis]|uniref:DUF3105 domain-containing protein n=1 Tax=Spirilliplanes yamanashiensis TaxID=42233 RepID=UPI002781EE75|nr:DUF3105 domain-containing protein [Spirilliplanes yamanashiensis]MDP9818375.1 hypothetical protein [Spirilliplanes yamanashiensis]